VALGAATRCPGLRRDQQPVGTLVPVRCRAQPHDPQALPLARSDAQLRRAHREIVGRLQGVALARLVPAVDRGMPGPLGGLVVDQPQRVVAVSGREFNAMPGQLQRLGRRGQQCAQQHQQPDPPHQ